MRYYSLEKGAIIWPLHFVYDPICKNIFSYYCKLPEDKVFCEQKLIETLKDKWDESHSIKFWTEKNYEEIFW